MAASAASRAAPVAWTSGVLLAVAVVLLPLVFVIRAVFAPAGDGWQDIAEFYLSDWIVGTIIMVVGVGVLTLGIGLVTAWVVSAYQFPGRRFFSLALMFPLAIPTYVACHCYGFILDGAQKPLLALKNNWGIDYALAESAFVYVVAVTVISFCLYPYVYIAARVAFADFSAAYLENSRILGRGMWGTFLRIAIPLARPAIVGGLLLVVMEVLNEYGAMVYFGIPTLTRGIFLAWGNLGELDSAVRVAGIMLLIVFACISLERLARGRARFHESRQSSRGFRGLKTSARSQACCVLLCATITGIGFGLPFFRLLSWAIQAFPSVDVVTFLALVGKSLGIAALASSVILATALFLAYAIRLYPKWWMRALVRGSMLGYALPGAVIGVAILVTFGKWDGYIAGGPTVFLVSGTATALIIAYFIRFLTVGFNPVEAGMKRINPNMDEASRLLGRTPLGGFFRLHLPILRLPILGALMVLFVDLMKELPLTFVLRPANFETLATRTFGLMEGEERIAAGSVPALVLVLTGVVTLVLLRKLIFKERLQA